MHPFHPVLAAVAAAVPTVPINTAAFHQIPGWLLVLIASVVGAYEVRHLGPRLNQGNNLVAHVFDFFELMLMGAVAVALSSTPLGVQILAFVQTGETSIAAGLGGTTFVHVSATVVLFAISILLGLWYLRTEKIWVAVLFGFSVMVLANVSPFADQLLGWMVNTVASTMWNVTLAIVVFIVGHL